MARITKQGVEMVNQIVSFAIFSASLLLQAMDDPCLKGPKDPNTALLLETINGDIDTKALCRIERLFDLGADPNYVSSLSVITPLMRAVRVNCPELVQLLIEKGSKVNVSDSDNKFVRDFNLIYSQKEVVPLVASITNDMLNFERHNELNPQKKIRCRDTIYSMKGSQIIRNAILIDKILEDHKAYSDILPVKHPFMQMLRDPRVKRAMSYIFTHHWKDLPFAIRYVLYGNGIPRATSEPGPLLTYSNF